MKKQLLLLVLSLALVFSTAAFAGCGMSSGSTGSTGNDGEHTHTYVKVDRVESTCVTRGTEEHYTCSGCESIFVKNGEEYVESALSSLALPLGKHNFTGITVTAAPATDYVAFDEFDTTGLEVTKTCSNAGCSGETANPIDITVAYPNGDDCLKVTATYVTVTVGEWSTQLTVSVSKKSVALPVLEGKAYTGSTLTADVPASDLYTVSENLGGVAPGEYDVKLTLTDSDNYAFEGVDGATATVKFTVLKQANTVTMPASIANVKCYEVPVVNATALDSAAISYVYSVTEDGEYTAIDTYGDGLDAGTWYVKAIAAETDNYSETVSDAVSFTVAHGLGGYIVGAKEDKPKCACGAEIDGTPFKTLVTDAPQYVLATAEGFATDMAKLTFGGTSIDEDTTFGAISCGSLVLGTATEPNVANVATLIAGTHGEKTFTVAVTDSDGYAHALNVPVILVTEVITDWDTLRYRTQMNVSKLTVLEDGTKECLFGSGEYYVLGSDIEGGTTNGLKYNDVSYDISDYGNWDYECGTLADMKGFGGTVDGRGYTITGIDVKYGGIFSSLNGATIKNLNLMVDSIEGANGIFAIHMGAVTMENINVVLTNALDLSASDAGVLVTQHIHSSTINNVNVYAPGCDIQYLIGQGHHAAVSNNTYTNIHAYAKSVTKVVQGVETLPGVTIHEVLTNEISTTQFLELASENISLTLPTTGFDGYVSGEVTINGAVVGETATTIDPEKVETALNGKKGSFIAVVSLVKDTHVVKLPVPVAVVTEVITSWQQLLYRVTYRTGVDADFGAGDYYVLGNDIVGANADDGFTYNGVNYTNGTPITSDAEGGFAGTLDGRGYTITSIDFAAYSIFGGINGGTIKNLNMEGTWYSWGWSLLSGSGGMFNATIENVKITLSNINTTDSTKDFTGKETGLIAGASQVKNCVFKNLVIHAEGIKVKYIVGQGYYCGRLEPTSDGHNSYTGCKIYVADYNYMGNTRTEPETNGGIKVYMDRQTVELSGETVSINVPTCISDYNIYRVRINGKDNMLIDGNTVEGGTLTLGGITYYEIDLKALSVAKIKEFIGENYGDYDIEITVTKNGWGYGYGGYIIPVKFVAPTAD